MQWKHPQTWGQTELGYRVEKTVDYQSLSISHYISERVRYSLRDEVRLTVCTLSAGTKLVTLNSHYIFCYTNYVFLSSPWTFERRYPSVVGGL